MGKHEHSEGSGSATCRVVSGELNLVSDGTSRTTDCVASGIEPQAPEPQPDATPDAAARKPLFLRVLLAIAVLALVALVAVLGVFAWRYGIAPNVEPAQTERLASNGTAEQTVTFDAVEADGLPVLDGLYGMTYKNAKKQLTGIVTFTGGLQEAGDERVASMAYEASGVVANAQGETVATVTLGLTKKKHKVVYASASYDLDALGVASAEFQVLANDRTVPASLLASVGVDEEQVQAAALSLAESAQPDGHTAGSSTQRCTYSGSTGAQGKVVTKTKTVTSKKTGKKVKKKVKVTKQVAFEQWTLEVVYERPTGTDDTLRTVVVELY